VRAVAGADNAISRDGQPQNAAVVVMRFPQHEVLEKRVESRPLTIPYGPG
jgi:deoxyinosine 3'endonuclease (endonuclease V)